MLNPSDNTMNVKVCSCRNFAAHIDSKRRHVEQETQEEAAICTEGQAIECAKVEPFATNFVAGANQFMLGAAV